MDGKGRKMGKGKEREGKEKDRTVKGRIGGIEGKGREKNGWEKGRGKGREGRKGQAVSLS